MADHQIMRVYFLTSAFVLVSGKHKQTVLLFTWAPGCNAHVYAWLAFPFAYLARSFSFFIALDCLLAPASRIYDLLTQKTINYIKPYTTNSYHSRSRHCQGRHGLSVTLPPSLSTSQWPSSRSTFVCIRVSGYACVS